MVGVYSYIIYCDLYRNDRPFLILCSCIVLFAESHDIDTLQHISSRVEKEKYKQTEPPSSCLAKNFSTWLNCCAMSEPALLAVFALVSLTTQ